MVGCRPTRDALQFNGTCAFSRQMFICAFSTLFGADALITYVPIFLTFVASDGLLDILANHYTCI